VADVTHTILNGKPRRTKLDIIANMLETTKEGSLKTQIMYKANLSFTQLNSYLYFLIENGFVKQTVWNRKEVYFITEKGVDFLQRHSELTRLLKK
jgi:predicted transcriptional regulator